MINEVLTTDRQEDARRKRRKAIPIRPFRATIHRTQDVIAPHFYLYTIKGKESTFKGLIGSIDLNAIEDSSILHHEETYQELVTSLYHTFLHEKIQYNPLLLVSDDPLFHQELFTIPFENELVYEHQLFSGDVHRLERIPGLCHQLDISTSLCIADGHHRFLALRNYYKNNSSTKSPVMAAIFNQNEVSTRTKGILIEMQSLNLSVFWETIHQFFEIVMTPEPFVPKKVSEFSLFFCQRWYLIKLKDQFFIPEKHVNLLNIELFKEFILRPVFNLSTYTRNKSVRVFFEKCNLTMIKNQVKGNNMVGFVLPSDPIDKVILAAREKRVLEPNSTYFEPKFMEDVIGCPLGMYDY